MTSKTKEYALTKLGWFVVAIPLIAFLAIVTINKFFFTFYNDISLWIAVGKIGFILSIAYVLTRAEETILEDFVFAIVLIAFLPVLIIIKFFPSYDCIIPWIAGVVINFLFIIAYNGWLCPHNWISNEMYRFCTKCHRSEIDMDYLSYGTYVLKNSLIKKDLKKQYKKEHSIVPFIISLLFTESILYFLMINLRS